MAGEIALLLVLSVCGAAFIVLHVVTLVQGLGAAHLGRGWRALALLPPATPAVAWMGGRRVTPVLWGLTLVAYGALRLWAHQAIP